ncbi:hypothetical protein [Vallitalea guaymasensis]|uniref:hypothetical protein n=1 Tax=Vallitalea guaymasensis TaxID=1185412 RepID=UPI00272D73B2|nr:hypothetical protein [Vallitalea guaymasensis]
MNYIYICTVILIIISIIFFIIDTTDITSFISNDLRGFKLIISIAFAILLPVMILSGVYHLNDISDNQLYIWLVKYACVFLSFIGFQVILYQNIDIK